MHGASIFSQISIKNHRLMKYANFQIDSKRTVISLNAPEYRTKKCFFEEATEEWYSQRDPVEVDWVECDCICQAEQFAHFMEEYRERFFTYVRLQSPTKSLAAYLKSYHLHRHYTSQLGNLDNIEVGPLEVDWIT